MFGDSLSDMAGELGVRSRSPRRSTPPTPDIAGQGLADPIAMILSSAMLLDWLGTRHGDERSTEAAARVEAGVRAAVRGGVATRDLGGSASTEEFTAAVVARIAGS